ncbi:MAG: hypothetical protein AAB355_03495 [Patescibacteria group bacterium]
MIVSEEIRSKIIKNWSLPPMYILRILSDEFMEQYSRAGQKDGERITRLKKVSRERLEQEIEDSLINDENESPDAFIEKLKGIEPLQEDSSEQELAVQWYYPYQ